MTAPASLLFPTALRLDRGFDGVLARSGMEETDCQTPVPRPNGPGQAVGGQFFFSFTTTRVWQNPHGRVLVIDRLQLGSPRAHGVGCLEEARTGFS